MQSTAVGFRRFAWQCVICLALAGAAVSPAFASGAGPNGVNIGFDFNWSFSNPPEPPGYSASFIATTSASGATLNNCGGPVTGSTVTCNFVMNYDVGGTPQPSVPPGGVYNTWTPTGDPNASICDQNPTNSAPLTLFNCFNNNSFGQVFTPSATGTLSNFSMSMTCLNPAGAPPTGLYALLYQVNAGGISIPATPLAQVPVDLSTCPTLTSWDAHTFTAGDFAPIPLNFSGVTLTQGVFYAVYFAGLVPGSQPPGITPTTTQTIVFTSSPASMTVGSSYLVTATGGASGNPVTFSIDAASTPGACTISGSTVTFTGVGTCIIDANQAGGGIYFPAPQVQQAIAIGPVAQVPTLARDILWVLAAGLLLVGLASVRRRRT